MHTLDIEAMKRWTSLSDFAASDTDWLRSRGADPAEIAAMVPEDRADGGMLAKLGRADVGLEDGDRPMGAGTPLRAIWTPGHTPGHLCFVHEEHGVLLTGDHILPRISPNISPAPNNDTDALGDYLGSLAAVADLEVDEVLPAHEYRFSGLAIRVGQLQAHHAQRLAEIIAVVADHSAATTFQIAERLTWSRPWSQTQGMIRRAAIGETYAHLLHLTRKGLLINGPGEVDDWQLSAAGAETIVG
jgi:glyoxylase-like metal-dependent hydrolase (beta-lactamase superfamily II)